MKKRYLAAALCIVTTLIFSAPGVEADEAGQSITFTLQQAIDYAMENSASIKLSNEAVAKAKVGFKEAKSAHESVEGLSAVERRGMGATAEMAFETFKMAEGYYKDMAAMGVTLAEKGCEQTVETVKMAVQNAYFNLLIAKERVKIQESMLNFAQKDMNIANKKYELGMVSQMDILSGEAALEGAKLSLSTALRDLEYWRMAFNKTLGLPLKTEATLVDDLTFEEPPETNPDEKAALALKNRFEVLAAKEQYKIDEKNFELTSSWYPENTYAHQQVKHQMESSRNKLISTEQDVELSTRKAYMDMQSAYESINVLSRNVEMLQKAYDIARLKYDTGMAISQEVVNARNALNEIELKRIEAIHGYNVAKVQFEAAGGIGIAAPGGF